MKNFKINQSITNRDLILKLYFKDIAKLPMLTQEQEVELALRVQQGDKKAEEKLIQANLRFVVSVAKSYNAKGLDLVDLIQEGNIGLIEGARRYDPTKGVKFISYTVWWIRQAIMQALSLKSKTVKLPINQSVLLSQIIKYSDSVEQKTGFKPSYAEIAGALNIEESKIPEILSYYKTYTSVDAPFNTKEDSGCLLDVIPNKNAENTDSKFMQESYEIEFLIILHKLPPRERVILQLYFGINCDKMPLERISKMIGMTTERARQLKENGIKILQIKYKEQLRKFLQ